MIATQTLRLEELSKKDLKEIFKAVLANHLILTVLLSNISSFLFILTIMGCLPLFATPATQDFTALQPLLPDSLRLTIRR